MWGQLGGQGGAQAPTEEPGLWEGGFREWKPGIPFVWVQTVFRWLSVRLETSTGTCYDALLFKSNGMDGFSRPLSVKSPDSSDYQGHVNTHRGSKRGCCFLGQVFIFESRHHPSTTCCRSTSLRRDCFVEEVECLEGSCSISVETKP